VGKDHVSEALRGKDRAIFFTQPQANACILTIGLFDETSNTFVGTIAAILKCWLSQP
jgi:hypothetical protein